MKIVLLLFAFLAATAFAAGLNLELADGTATLISDGSVVLPQFADPPAADAAPLFGPADLSVPFRLRNSGAAPLRFSFRAAFYGAESGSSFGVAGIADAGVLPPNATLLFNASSSCATSFVGTVSWTFALLEADDTSPQLLSVGFLWRCAAPGCSELCQEPRGVCNVLEGVCECAGDWRGPDCNVLAVFPETVCPGEEFLASFAVASLPELGAWVSLADWYDVTRDWRYIRTGNCVYPSLPDDGVLNDTAAGSWTIHTMLEPGSYTWWVIHEDATEVATLPMEVLPWESCGVDNSTCAEDADCSGGACDADTAMCVCDSGRFWADCSRGCDAFAVVSAAEGTLSSDPGATNATEMRYMADIICEWLVTVPPPVKFDMFTITVTALSLEEGDSVQIFAVNSSDSAANESLPVATWKGKTLPQPITVAARGFRVVFATDYANGATGFALSYSTVRLPMSSGTIAAITVPSLAAMAALVVLASLLIRRAHKKRLAAIAAEANRPELDLLSEQEDRLKKSTDPAAMIQSLAALGVSVNPGPGSELTLGLEGNAACPIGENISQQLILQNTGGKTVFYAFSVPRDAGRFECTVRPGCGKLLPGTGVSVLVTFKMLCTMRLDRRIRISFAAGAEDGEVLAETFMILSLNGALSERLDPDEIILGPKMLGLGAFGVVFVGSYRGRPVAVKVPHHQNQTSEAQIELFQKEAALCNKLRHPLLVEFIGASLVPQKFCMVTELFDHGNLDNLLKNADIPFELQLRYAANIAEALSYLHANHVIHRDVKASNVLIVSTSARAKVCCKLGDFGTSKNVEDVTALREYTMNGTVLFMAPEMFERSPYNAKVDVFALAVTLWQMMARRNPWEGVQIWHIPNRVLKGERPEIPANCPAEYGELISRMWHADQAARPDCSEIVLALGNLKEAARNADSAATAAAESAEGSTATVALTPQVSRKAKKALQRRARREQRQKLSAAATSGSGIELEMMSGGPIGGSGSSSFGTRGLHSVGSLTADQPLSALSTME